MQVKPKWSTAPMIEPCFLDKPGGNNETETEPPPGAAPRVGGRDAAEPPVREAGRGLRAVLGSHGGCRRMREPDPRLRVDSGGGDRLGRRPLKRETKGNEMQPIGTVGEICSRDVVAVTRDTTITEAAKLM